MKKEKAILLSVRPEHVVNILNGDKTLELRKNTPKNFKGWVYIYVTKNGGDIEHACLLEERYYRFIDYGYAGEIEDDSYPINGLVVARFWLDEIEELKYDENLEIATETMTHEDLLKNACVDYYDLNNYFSNESATIFGFAWHIKKLEIFDVPYDLSYFYKKRTDKEYAQKLLEFSFIYDNGETPLRYIELERAPQNWQYVFFSKGAIV